MNALYVGFRREIELPPQKDGYLLIDDEPERFDAPQPIIFDPNKHSFNPLKGMNYRKAVATVEALKAVFPGGENTLTKEDAEHALMEALMSKPEKLADLIPKSKEPGKEKARRMIERLLLSPLLSTVLCSPHNQFSFNPRSVILARVNRAEIGEFDAKVLVYLLMIQFKGQLVISDFGAYGLDSHANLVRENRLIAGVNYLGELPVKLRQAVLSIEDRIPAGATFEDAEVLAKLAGHRPDPSRKFMGNPYDDFIADAMA